MIGNCQVRFLGEGDTATCASLPDKKFTRSVEYKTTGWKLSSDKRSIKFTDGFEVGSFKLVGTRELHYYAPSEIKRVRIVRRADGYYCQFCVAVERKVESEPTGNAVGIDVGLKFFLTDSNGEVVENPRHLRKPRRLYQSGRTFVSVVLY